MALLDQSIGLGLNWLGLAWDWERGIGLALETLWTLDYGLYEIGLA